MLRADTDAYQESTKAIVVENTNNFGGGTIQPLEAISALRAATFSLDVATHLDEAAQRS